MKNNKNSTEQGKKIIKKKSLAGLFLFRNPFSIAKNSKL